jgi:hypothetical protein
MNTPDLLNMTGLALDGFAALLLLATAPIPQRSIYMLDEEQGNRDFHKDRRTRKAHYLGFVMLACGFLLQLVSQLLR